MSLSLLTPFSQILRRSVAVKSGQKLIPGRWAEITANGECQVPAAGDGKGYLIVEGTHVLNAVLAAGDFAGTTPYLPTDGTKLTALPSVAASNQAALAYGPLRATVGPEGFVAGAIAIGDLLKLDDGGRLIEIGTGEEALAVAVAEAVSASALTFRTLA